MTRDWPTPILVSITAEGRAHMSHIPAGRPVDEYLIDVAHSLKEGFGVQHVAIQVETDPASPCALAPDHVV